MPNIELLNRPDDTAMLRAMRDSNERKTAREHKRWP